MGSSPKAKAAGMRHFPARAANDFGRGVFRRGAENDARGGRAPRREGVVRHFTVVLINSEWGIMKTARSGGNWLAGNILGGFGSLIIGRERGAARGCQKYIPYK